MPRELNLVPARAVFLLDSKVIRVGLERNVLELSVAQ